MYLAEKFGFDRGRILSLYPKKWLPLAIDAADHLPPYEKKRVVEKLVASKRDSSIRKGRNYDPAIGGWLDNALAQQAIDPFRAIIACERRRSEACVTCVLTADEVEEANPLISVPHDAAIAREGTDLGGGNGTAIAVSTKSVVRRWVLRFIQRKVSGHASRMPEDGSWSERGCSL
jgi:hypothetical protein